MLGLVRSNPSSGLALALWPDPDDRVGREGIVLLRQLLEDLQEFPVAHLLVDLLPPRDKAGERALCTVPLDRDRLLVLVARDQHAAKFDRTLEMHRVVGPLWVLVYGTNDVPARFLELLDEGPTEVGLRVERESAAHLSRAALREGLGLAALVSLVRTLVPRELSIDLVLVVVVVR